MFYRIAIVLVVQMACAPLATYAEPLNVVVILADDLNCALGCYRHPVCQTPNIDQLAVRSVRFDRAYCQYPVCNPSRTSLMSGLRPETTRVVDNRVRPQDALPRAIWMPEWFRRHGYRTMKAGKIFHTGNGFEDPPVWDVALPEDPKAKSPSPETIEREQGDRGLVLNVPDEATWDGRLATKAIELLERGAADERPFFLMVGFRRPHAPYMAPRRYFDLYPPAAMRPPEEPADHLRLIPPVALTYEPGRPMPADGEMRDTMAAYYATTSFLDAQVGRVTAALDRLDLWKNTVVVLASDHGYHLYEHGGLLHKMTVFEESARVPLLVAAPGAKAGSASPALVELVDLYATLADLGQLPAPTQTEGTSFAPLLVQPERPWKKAAFTVVSHAGGKAGGDHLDPDRLGRSIRTPRWRYTQWHEGSRELYDHDADPRELNNLAGDPAFAARVAELESQLDAGWRAALPAGKTTDADTQRTLGLFRDGVQHYQLAAQQDDYDRWRPDQVAEIAENLLVYHRANGGWPKNFDPARVLSAAERDEQLALRDKADTTFDNRGTYPCVEYLAGAFQAIGEPRYREACLRGIEFILSAQYDNGGFPHTFPNRKGYYGHITLLDDVQTGLLRTLRKAGRGEAPFAWFDDDLRARCARAHERGQACLLELQHREAGQLTAWCGQYDERTLEPAWGRTFEPPSLVSAESAGVVRYLMDEPDPSPAVRDAIVAAIDWLRAARIAGYRQEVVPAPEVAFDGRTSREQKILVADEAAPPLWARFYEFGTGRALMCNRDGQVVYRLEDVDRERLMGYAWYTQAPASVVEREYPPWAKRVGMAGE